MGDNEHNEPHSAVNERSPPRGTVFVVMGAAVCQVLVVCNSVMFLVFDGWVMTDDDGTCNQHVSVTPMAIFRAGNNVSSHPVMVRKFEWDGCAASEMVDCVRRDSYEALSAYLLNRSKFGILVLL